MVFDMLGCYLALQGHNVPYTDRMGNPATKPPVIGIAGGVGSGKSTVAAILASLGCLVLDADEQAELFA